MVPVQELKTKYTQMFEHLNIKQQQYPVVAYVSNKIFSNKSKYELTPLIPFYVVGAIHYREANFNFNTHLHNGDPLNDRTVHVPRGRPVNGKPPFTWQESAIDALMLKRNFIPKEGLNKIGEILVFCEAYNGFGYYYRKISSPYLWNGSQYYEKGKFKYDSKFDVNLVDKQVGVACIIYYGMIHDFWRIDF